MLIFAAGTRDVKVIELLDIANWLLRHQRSVTIFSSNTKSLQPFFNSKLITSVCCHQFWKRKPLAAVSCFGLVYPITLPGRWGTTDDFATTPFNFVLSSAALVELAKSIPVHSLILSSHLFFCLPLLFLPFTVPCWNVFAKQFIKQILLFSAVSWFTVHKTVTITIIVVFIFTRWMLVQWHMLKHSCQRRRFPNILPRE